MGILKHGVLPFFVIVHVVFLSFYVTGNFEGLIALLEWPRSEEPLTIIEQHGLAAGVMGSVLVLLFAGLVGIFKEDSHFRGLVGAMHLIFYANDTYDYWKLGLDPTGAGVLATLALVGVVVHSQEPGFFTKDKETTRKKKS